MAIFSRERLFHRLNIISWEIEFSFHHGPAHPQGWRKNLRRRSELPSTATEPPVVPPKATSLEHSWGDGRTSSLSLSLMVF